MDAKLRKRVRGFSAWRKNKFQSMPSYGYLAYINTSQGRDGLLFANRAMEFTSLGCIAEQTRMVPVSVNLYSTAIELAFKSLALRSGATMSQCEKAGHRISKILSIIQSFKIKIPEHLDRKLNDDNSFKNRLLGTRYTVFDPKEVITYHKNYPEMIAEILEIPCPIPLKFADGSALAELKKLVVSLKQPAQKEKSVSTA